MIDTVLILSIPFILSLIGYIGIFCEYRKYQLSLNMFNQSGIREFTLYDLKDVSFDYVTATEVTNISGTSIVIDSESIPNLKQKVVTINRKNHFEYIFSFTYLGLASEVGQLRNKVGWLTLIEFLDGEKRFLTSPIFYNETEIDTSQGNFYPIEMKPDRPTVKTLNVV